MQSGRFRKTPTSIKNHKYAWLFASEWQMVHNRMDGNSFTFFIGGNGCQPKDSKVLMANGEWKNIQDIKIGDYVLSPQQDKTNVFSKVINITSWHSNENYDVTQLLKKQKKLYTCSHNHLIPIVYTKSLRKTINNKRVIVGSEIIFKNKNPKEIMKCSKLKKRFQNQGFTSFKIDNFYNRSNCEIDAYSLGVFLGDGMFYSKRTTKRLNNSLNITSQDKNILDEVTKHYPLLNVVDQKNNKSKSYVFSLKGNFAKVLTKYNLKGVCSGTKFIPKSALHSDFNYRLKLLAGLIDTDGYYSKSSYSIVSKSKQLVKDIEFLVYSLGGRASINCVRKKCYNNGKIGKYYCISFYLGKLKIPVVLDYKKKKSNCFYRASNFVAIDIKKSKPKKVYGFTLDSNSQWYVTDNFMVTHNSGKTFADLTRCEIMGVDEHDSYGKLFDPDHLENHVFFDRQDMQNKIAELEKLPSFKTRGYQLMLDEAQMTANAKQWNDRQILEFSKEMTTIRSSRFNISMTMPTFKMITTDLRQLGTYMCEMFSADRINRQAGVSYSKLHLLALKPYIGEVWRHRPYINFKEENPLTGIETGHGGLLSEFTWELPSPTVRRNYEKMKKEFRKVSSEKKATVDIANEKQKVNGKRSLALELKELAKKVLENEVVVSNEKGKVTGRRIAAFLGIGADKAYSVRAVYENLKLQS